MREHLVALFYVLLIAVVCFAVMAQSLTARVILREDFIRRRNLFVALTAVIFLSHNFWLAMLASGLTIAIVGRRDGNPVALYGALMFIVPLYELPIPGFGLINQLFGLSFLRVLALVLLLPVTLALLREDRAPNRRLRIADMLFLTYLFYISIMNATIDSLTGLMRFVVEFTLDYGLLYFVITRSVVNSRRMLDVLASLVMGLAVIGVIGSFETLRHWLVYESLRAPLEIPRESIGSYLLRRTEDGDYLRAYATTGHAIVLGTVSMLAVIFQLALARHYVASWRAIALIAMPMLGLLASVSRGPWLSCAIVVTLGLMAGPRGRKRMGWMLVAIFATALALVAFPQGQKFIDLLPFVGSAEPGSVYYRTQLIDRAWVVFLQNPIFGSLSYIHNPVLEEMRQGQGIIDIVNSYIGVALPYGLVGLLLFVAPSLYALQGAWSTSRTVARANAKIGDEVEAVGRALAMSLLGILLVLGSVSYILYVPIVHVFVLALCTAFAAYAPLWPSRPAFDGMAADRVLPPMR